MEPIALTEFETLVVTNFKDENQKVPFDCPGTYIGGLEGGNCGYIYASRCSAKYYRIFAEFGTIGKPIPVEVDTFARLRQWCAEQINKREDERARLEMLWRSRVDRIENAARKSDLYGPLPEDEAVQNMANVMRGIKIEKRGDLCVD